ncbi:hypothetical protein DFH06DRAFT_1149526 [Mycena polygramma]|nr:hypothetical protein DFH06DRAFT_1149526 [Mycena polygramma]
MESINARRLRFEATINSLSQARRAEASADPRATRIGLHLTKVVATTCVPVNQVLLKSSVACGFLRCAALVVRLSWLREITYIPLRNTTVFAGNRTLGASWVGFLRPETGISHSNEKNPRRAAAVIAFRTTVFAASSPRKKPVPLSRFILQLPGPRSAAQFSFFGEHHVGATGFFFSTHIRSPGGNQQAQTLDAISYRFCTIELNTEFPRGRIPSSLRLKLMLSLSLPGRDAVQPSERGLISGKPLGNPGRTYNPPSARHFAKLCKTELRKDKQYMGAKCELRRAVELCTTVFFQFGFPRHSKKNAGKSKSPSQKARGCWMMAGCRRKIPTFALSSLDQSASQRIASADPRDNRTASLSSRLTLRLSCQIDFLEGSRLNLTHTFTWIFMASQPVLPRQPKYARFDSPWLRSTEEPRSSETLILTRDSCMGRHYGPLKADDWRVPILCRHYSKRDTWQYLADGTHQ